MNADKNTLNIFIDILYPASVKQKRRVVIYTVVCCLLSVLLCCLTNCLLLNFLTAAISSRTQLTTDQPQPTLDMRATS